MEGIIMGDDEMPLNPKPLGKMQSYAENEKLIEVEGYGAKAEIADDLKTVKITLNTSDGYTAVTMSLDAFQKFFQQANKALRVKKLK
jgi:hypothetical protein